MKTNILLLVLVPESNEKLKLMNIQESILKISGNPSVMELEPFVPLLYLNSEVEISRAKENIKQIFKEKKLRYASDTIRPGDLLKVENSIFINLETGKYLEHLREILLHRNPQLFHSKPQRREIPLFDGILLTREIDTNSYQTGTILKLKPEIETIKKLKLGILRIQYDSIETVWELSEIFKVYTGQIPSTREA